MRRVRLNYWMTLSIGVLCASGFFWQGASAQQRALFQPVQFGNRSRFDLQDNAPSFVTNREMSHRLSTARKRILDQDYRTAVRYLQSLLDEREDWFIERSTEEKPRNPNGPPIQPTDPDFAESQTNFQSLKNSAEDLVGKLPRAARQVYEQEYGITAKAQLKEAIAAGDETQLSEIGRRFFHTQAGYEAVYRLGLMKADHGEPFAAALQFQRLQNFPQIAKRFEPLLSLKLAFCWDQAGLPGQSLAVLRRLKRESPQQKIRVGQREISWFDREEEANSWLAGLLGQGAGARKNEAEQWPVFRGNASRSATSSPASPIGPVAWSKQTLRGNASLGISSGQMAKLDNALKSLAKTRADNIHLLPVPVMMPLIQNNRAIFRTLQNVQCVDLTTGETLWKTAQVDPIIRPVLSHVTSQQEQVLGNNPFGPVGNPKGQKSAVDSFLVQRHWRDMTFGMISCDSQRVYSVEELGMADGIYFASQDQADPFLPRTENKLMAFGMESGMAQWEVGGPLLAKDDRLGGTFFLGPPLPIGEQLFCLGEKNNEISLVILEASTGKLAWEQRLVSPALNLFSNRERRVMGLTPSYGHGVMICPTASGAVVGVDISRRMLLWAYQYESTQTEDSLVDMPWQRGRNLEFSHESVHPESRWADTVPVVAEGKVLITPSDSRDLHCLDLSTGEEQWKLPRSQGVFLAGVDRGLAIVVGRSQVRALQLADGRDAWSVPVAIPAPAGRGFFAEEKYHLPLSTGEIATIDTQQGRLLARTKLPAGQSVGNLVSAGGRVVFQSLDSIGAFTPWNQLNTRLQQDLKANPHDAAALTLRGKLKLHQGKPTEALADLRQSWANQPMEETRSLLVKTLIDQMRTKAPGHAAHREELGQLITTPEESLQFLMLTASGANSPESRLAAFQDYMQEAAKLKQDLQLQTLTGGHKARSDRWIKARIEQLASQASDEELKQWDQLLAKELLGSSKEMPKKIRLSIYDCFSQFPSVQKAVWELATEQIGQQKPLLQTALYKRLQNSSNKQVKSDATLALAVTYLNLGREAETYAVIQDMGEKWPAEWKENFKDLKAPEPIHWPDVKPTAKFAARPVAVLPEIAVELKHAEHTPYAHWTFSIDQQTRKLMARDENGSVGWQWDLTEANGPVLDLHGITISLHGHVAVVSLQTYFVVLDLLERQNSARVMWSALLIDAEIDRDELLRIQQFQRHPIFGNQLTDQGTPFGEVKMLGDDVILYLAGERLTAAEALTGKILWVQQHQRSQSQIFGDRQHAILVAPGRSDATVFRLTDGEQLRQTELPKSSQLLLIEGASCLQWSKPAGQFRLECRSMIDGALKWKRDLAVISDLRRVGLKELAFFQPDGQFTILSLVDGKVIVNEKLEADANLQSYQVLPLAQCYVLLTDRNNALRQQGFQVENQNTTVNGPAYGFDRDTGKQLWKTLIENQSLEQAPPYNSPVLVFNKRKQPNQWPQGQGFGGNFLMRILDLQTGEIFFTHNNLQNATPLGIRLFPARKTVTVTFHQGVIDIKYLPDVQEENQ